MAGVREVQAKDKQSARDLSDFEARVENYAADVMEAGSVRLLLKLRQEMETTTKPESFMVILRAIINARIRVLRSQ